MKIRSKLKEGVLLGLSLSLLCGCSISDKGTGGEKGDVVITGQFDLQGVSETETEERITTTDDPSIEGKRVCKLRQTPDAYGTGSVLFKNDVVVIPFTYLYSYDADSNTVTLKKKYTLRNGQKYAYVVYSALGGSRFLLQRITDAWEDENGRQAFTLSGIPLSTELSAEEFDALIDSYVITGQEKGTSMNDEEMQTSTGDEPDNEYPFGDVEETDTPEESYEEDLEWTDDIDYTNGGV